MRCPECDRCAQVRSEDGRRILSCPNCHTNQEKPIEGVPVEGIHSLKQGNEPHFDVEYWLTTRCAGEVLWAVNENHLAHLEKSFADSERLETEPFRDASAAKSRLPPWMVLGRNRREVLRGLSRLRIRLAS